MKYIRGCGLQNREKTREFQTRFQLGELLPASHILKLQEV